MEEGGLAGAAAGPLQPSRWGAPAGGAGEGASGSGTGRPHHDAGEQAHALPAVGVGHHVAVADGEEGDGDEPHRAQEVAGHFLLVVVPGGAGVGAPSVHNSVPASITPLGRAGAAGPWAHHAHRHQGPLTLATGGGSVRGQEARAPTPSFPPSLLLARHPSCCPQPW